jgi:sporulation protein YlmC with PRC-barrel domain
MKYIRASQAQVELPREIEGLEGREVVDRDGDKIGHVIDILLDQFHHEQSFIEIETDGFLGMGRKHLLAPLRWDETDKDPITVDAVKRELHDAPDYQPSMMLSEEYETAMAGYWNLPYHWTKPPAIRDPFVERPGELHSMRPEQFSGDPHKPRADSGRHQRRDERET